MKVYIYEGGKNLVEKSGVGVSIAHQKVALKSNYVNLESRWTNKSDIVQINTVLPDSVVMALLSKLRGEKVVYYGHSTMEDFQNSFIGSNFLAPAFKKWIKFCYGLGDVLITPTDYSKELIESYGIKAEIMALSNGIDLDYFNRGRANVSRFREKYHLKENDKIIVCAGHYIERKGILDFVKIAEEKPEYKFFWFGHTDESIITKKVREAIHKDLPNLYFPGYITKEELRDAYAGANIFLFLSKEETEGIVVLEAMAMKTPVIVRDIPVYEGWLVHGENVYKGKNSNEFIKLIDQLISEKDEYVVENAYKVVEKRDIKKVGERLVHIYKELLEDPYRSAVNRKSKN